MSIQENSSAIPTEFAPDAHTEPEFVCACENSMRSACAGEVFFREHEGRRYCVLHYPGKDKTAAFNAALQKKLAAQDFNFRGVWFPEMVSFVKFQFNADANFSNANFSMEAVFSFATFGAVADFSYAKFRAFADFISTTFNVEAKFFNATFGAAASFFNATFGSTADFLLATFNTSASFTEATFRADADFTYATFNTNADFDSATFAAHVRFAEDEERPVFGDRSYLNLQHTRIEKPERVSFHTLTLRPHWFVNADARKFEFVNVRWRTSLRREINELSEKELSECESLPHRLLSITYRQLAVNAEENHRYNEASEFRYASMDVRRQEEWWGMAFWRLAWWYWLLSGYGEHITRATVCLLLILILFAGLYTQVGFVPPADQTTRSVALTTPPDTIGMPLRFTQSLIYSFEVSILQKPEPKPLTLAARLLVGLETVLGPLQAALLALAIRRKFMR